MVARAGQRSYAPKRESLGPECEHVNWWTLTSRGACAEQMADNRKSVSEGLSKLRRSLFVRNLPYTTRDEQLAAVFEKFGPLKSCFTVKDAGKAYLVGT